MNEDYKENNVVDLVSKFHRDLLDKLTALEKENNELKQKLKMSPKFYYDSNYDNWSFVDKTINDDNNGSLKTILDDGEIEGYASESYVQDDYILNKYMNANGYQTKKYNDLEEVSFLKFYHYGIKPIIDYLINKNQQLERQIEGFEKLEEEDKQH